jgi:hypothetical protein
MRALTTLALLLACAAAGAAASARASALLHLGVPAHHQHEPAQPAHHHEHGHGGHGGHSGWMMHPFSFDADFEGDGTCDVHREGDGRGGYRGSDSCEKDIRGSMRVECERGGGARLSARTRGALGSALARRVSDDAGDALPPNFVNEMVLAALADAPPQMMDQVLAEGRGELRLEARHRFKLKCTSDDAIMRNAMRCAAVPRRRASALTRLRARQAPSARRARRRRRRTAAAAAAWRRMTGATGATGAARRCARASGASWRRRRAAASAAAAGARRRRTAARARSRLQRSRHLMRKAAQRMHRGGRRI